MTPPTPVKRRLRLAVVLAMAAVVSLGGYATRKTWLRIAAESLVCAASETASDAVLVDNVEPNYLLFERAEELQTRGLASAVLVPVLRSASADEPSAVSMGIVEVMCRISRLPRCTTFDAPSTEPISLNLAQHTARELEAREIRSILLVTAGFRSQRSLEVYTAALEPRGIAVRCQPVFGLYNPANWFESAHGIQDVALQFLKLWYYRVVVLPHRASGHGATAP